MLDTPSPASATEADAPEAIPAATPVTAPADRPSRTLSGIKPTGRLTLGNYLGAIRQWVRRSREDTGETVLFVADLHALTVAHDPALLRERTAEAAALYLACGVDAQRCVLTVQSHVHAHLRLAWLMESTAYVGEMERMIQYKEKSRLQQSVRLSLLSYPALMAADILAYGADEVPVGNDQAQHVELARDLALRFNHRYGPVFRVPRVVLPTVGARIMDLLEPTAKMGKSGDAGSGVVFLLDDADTVRRKIRRAVTDTVGVVGYDPVHQPGVSNLLTILAACTGGEPTALADEFRVGGYRALKDATADAVVETLTPIQARYAELTADPSALAAVLRDGAARAAALAEPIVGAAEEAVGLLPAG